MDDDRLMRDLERMETSIKELDRSLGDHINQDRRDFDRLHDKSDAFEARVDLKLDNMNMTLEKYENHLKDSNTKMGQMNDNLVRLNTLKELEINQIKENGNKPKSSFLSSLTSGSVPWYLYGILGLGYIAYIVYTYFHNVIPQ